MIPRVVALTGTARPSPTPATAVLIPITRPRPSTSAPPELPGLSAASVWITSSTTRTARPERVGSERPSAETTPAVTELAKPCGLPIATTSWPTCSAAASPSGAGSGVGSSARSTARSESGSAPTIRSVSSRPSVNEPRTRAAAPSTTCAEVSRKPSGVKTTPEPAPVVRPRRVSRRLATDGDTVAATCVTTREYASSASVSSGDGASGVTCRTIATPRRSAPPAAARSAMPDEARRLEHVAERPGEPLERGVDPSVVKSVATRTARGSGFALLACVQSTVASPQQLADLLAKLAYHVNRTASPDMFRVLGEVGLSFTQMKALYLLAELGESSVKELADRLSMSLPAMSRSVDGLVGRGFVARRECEHDRRSKLIALLPQGREVLDRLAAAREAALVEFAGELPDDERTALHKALLPIVERIHSLMTDRLRLSEDNRRWWTLGAMCFALFMIMLDNTAVNVALPSIQRSFDASLSSLEWTVNAYTLTFAVLLVTGGRLGDIFGRRRMFLFGVVVFALASATIGFAPSDGWLVASRAIQGDRRGVHDARHPLDHLQRVPAARARQGDRHLGRRVGDRARDRPAASAAG